MEFLYNENTVKESANITDRWVLSFMQSLIAFFETEMAGVSLLTLLPGLRTLNLYDCSLTFHLQTKDILCKF